MVLTPHRQIPKDTSRARIQLRASAVASRVLRDKDHWRSWVQSERVPQPQKEGASEEARVTNMPLSWFSKEQNSFLQT